MDTVITTSPKVLGPLPALDSFDATPGIAPVTTPLLRSSLPLDPGRPATGWGAFLTGR
ncbi:hypothetical protein [Streptomyces microflavus]|uniref:Uncharacterized protein n=1 Tax=Streptomyces microflavus TaxID=1919 RepID=A0ABV1QFB3_STRMI